MVEVKFVKFISDFNAFYQTNYWIIQLQVAQINDAIYDLYGKDEFEYEIDWDKEVFQLY